MKSKTHYEVLGVSPSISPEELHAVYRAMALNAHPDRFPKANARKLKEATDRFAEITEAYAVLKDAKRRKTYDAQLSLLGRNCPECKGSGKKTINRGFRAGSSKTVDCPRCGGSGRG